MKRYKLEKDEVVLHEYDINYKDKDNIKLVLTNESIIIVKEIKLINYKMIMEKVLLSNLHCFIK